jgi:hypothetical protein
MIGSFASRIRHRSNPCLSYSSAVSPIRPFYFTSSDQHNNWIFPSIVIDKCDLADTDREVSIKEAQCLADKWSVDFFLPPIPSRSFFLPLRDPQAHALTSTLFLSAGTAPSTKPRLSSTLTSPPSSPSSPPFLHLSFHLLRCVLPRLTPLLLVLLAVAWSVRSGYSVHPTAA